MHNTYEARTRRCKIVRGLLAALMMLAVLLTLDPVSAAVETRQNGASGYRLIIDDTADYFSQSEIAELADLMEEISAYCNVALLTTTEHSFYSTFDYAENYFDSAFGARADGVIFVIDRRLNEIFLYTNGNVRSAITDSHAYSITDNTYRYATSAKGYDYYMCSYKSFEQVLTLLSGRRIAQPMKYLCSVLLALIAALLINYFIAMFLSRSRKADIRDILTGTYNNVRVNNPNTAFTGQTKRYSPQSSGGGGGRSHGGGGRSGGGGGRSHGGGGGHRI